jgi:hypothetical protein
LTVSTVLCIIETKEPGIWVQAAVCEEHLPEPAVAGGWRSL